MNDQQLPIPAVAPGEPLEKPELPYGIVTYVQFGGDTPRIETYGFLAL